MSRPLVALLVAALSAGCADPYEDQTRDQRDPDQAGAAQTVPDKPAPARTDQGDAGKPEPPDPPGQLPGWVPPDLRDAPDSFPAAGDTPEQTLARGAELYGNWTSATARKRFQQIAALSVGQARAELRQVAAQSGTDAQQQDITSRARVEVIDVDGSGSQRRALVVTRQRVDGPGLPQAGWSYQITVARLKRRATKWVISRWVPQP